jgi:hypothetical protein
VVVIAHGRTLAAGSPAELRESAGGGSLEDVFVRLTTAKVQR